MVLKHFYLKSNRPAAEVKSMAVTLIGDAERNAEHFGTFPQNRAYELEFPVPGDLGMVE